MKKLLIFILYIPFISNAGYKRQLDYIDYQGAITVKDGAYTLNKNFNSSEIPNALQTVENFFKIEKDIEGKATSLLLSTKPSYMSLDYVKVKLNGPLNVLLNGNEKGLIDIYLQDVDLSLRAKLEVSLFFNYYVNVSTTKNLPIKASYDPLTGQVRIDKDTIQLKVDTSSNILFLDTSLLSGFFENSIKDSLSDSLNNNIPSSISFTSVYDVLPGDLYLGASNIKDKLRNELENLIQGRFIGLSFDYNAYRFDSDSIDSSAPSQIINGYSFNMNINNKLILNLQSNPIFKYVWQSCSYNTSIICNEEF